MRKLMKVKKEIDKINARKAVKEIEKDREKHQ